LFVSPIALWCLLLLIPWLHIERSIMGIHGSPMEEQRQRYGPPLYELTSFAIALRVFVSLWWSSFDHAILYVTSSFTMISTVLPLTK
jgi:hypothetical protein